MSKKDARYSGYANEQGMYFGNKAQRNLEKLPSGVYTLSFHPMVGPILEPTEAKYDKLVDLQNEAYKRVLRDIETFLKPETQAKFAKYGFVYKRSALLHGLPGTGKTCIVNRVMEKARERDAIVLFNPNPTFLHEAFTLLEQNEPGRMVMVIFEEFDDILRKHEGTLLSLLDGEVQKSNVMYLATTNYVDRIPARIMRPGRFSSIIEVGYPSESERLHFLRAKLPEHADTVLSQWARETEGFSIDELKDTILSVECLDYALTEAVQRVQASKDRSAPLVDGQAKKLANHMQVVEDLHDYVDGDF